MTLLPDIPDDLAAEAGIVRGRLAPADLIWHRDQKWRPVEPGTFPLVDGAPARVGRLRAYGNALVAPVAEVFISAYMTARSAVVEKVT